MTSGDTLNTLFLATIGRELDRPAVRRRISAEGWADVSWRQYGESVRAVAQGLVRLGCRPGDRAVILSANRLEWLYADMGIIGAAAVSVPIYEAAREAEVAHILADSGARFAFVEDGSQQQKLARALAGDRRISLEKVFVLDASAPIMIEGAVRLDELLELGREGEAYETRARIPRPSDLATLLYTSGTTGVPKGVMTTHEACVWQARATNAMFGLAREDVVLSFLSLAHLLARTTTWRSFLTGYLTVYAPLRTMLEDLRKVSPTAMLSVPRMYEKIHASLLERARMSPASREEIASWLREATGGRLRFAYSAGAPLAQAVARWFRHHDLPIVEGYGLTEAAGGVHANSRDRFKENTVGVAIPGLETRLDAEGEILVRGPTVMRGYYNLPDATRDAIDPDGWLNTGDIGVLDAEGFLSITDRKKDLLKTSGGKYVAPQKLENLLRASPPISRAAVFGDGRKYCVALVTVDPESARRLVTSAGRDPARSDLASDEAVREAVAASVERVNAELASFETIKAFRILPREFEGEEVTSTLKLRRRVIGEAYRSLIDEMYA